MINNKFIGLAALLSASFASICCIGPIVLAGLGIGSLGLAAGLTQYRLLFLGLTAIVLALGFYYAYRKRPVACADGSCEVRSSSRTIKAGLWGLTVLTVALATFPAWSARLLSQEPTKVPADAKTLALRVSGMTCTACAASIEKSVKKVPGVYSAQVDFDSGRAVVKTRTGVDTDAVLKAVETAGYKAQIVEGIEDGRSRT